jgi:hypothetical protein
LVFKWTKFFAQIMRGGGVPIRLRSGQAFCPAVVVVAMVLVLCGCEAPKVAKPLTHSLPADPLSAQMEFWHGLENRPLTCNDEAFHGLLLFIDGSDDSKDYSERVHALKSRHLLGDSFDRPADEAVQRGTIAVALVKVLKIKGGLVMSVIGPLPRYATRELVYMDLYPPSSPQQTFSGSEFVGIIGKAEDYQREQMVASANGK